MTTSFNWKDPVAQRLLQSLPGQLSQMASDLWFYDERLDYAATSLSSGLLSLAGDVKTPDTLSENPVTAQAFAAWLHAQLNAAHGQRALTIDITGLADEVDDRHGLRAFETQIMFRWGAATLTFNISFKHSDEYGVTEDSIMIELNGHQHADFLNSNEDPFPEHTIERAVLDWFYKSFKPNDPDFSSPYSPERKKVLDALSLAADHMLKQD